MNIKDKYKDWTLKRYVAKWGSKNRGYFNCFTKDWFTNHQSTLLYLCNHPILKYWFRWILRIHKDLSLKEDIFELQPNNYKVKIKDNDDGTITLRADFRTHRKFSKRLYFAFKPVWWAAHYWDMIFADKFVPELSFGFTTLTAYPDPDPETDTFDGKAFRNYTGGETFADIRSGNGTNNYDDEDISNFIQAASITDEFSSLYRGQMLFDTSDIGSSSTISSAVFTGRGRTKDTGLDAMGCNICNCSTSSTTSGSNSDFENTGWTAYSTAISGSSFTAGSDHDFTLNSTGLAAIDKSGITYIGFAGEWDMDGTFGGTWSSGAYSRSSLHSADQGGSSYGPKLVVTYTVLSTGYHTIV